MKVASFFAGVGGIDKGFEEAGFEIIWANEFDKYAAETYKLNFRVPLVIDDIRNIKTQDIPDFDIMIAGFPCQAFSVAGYRKGFNDERGNLFFELERIFVEKRPRVIFLENVKNLVSHDNGNTFRVILKKLKEAGYRVKKDIMNACDYGNLPQNRERIYIVAFYEEDVYKEFEFPEPLELTNKLRDFFDYENLLDKRYYYTKENCSFFEELNNKVINPETTYQWRRIYVRENKSNLCPTLTANMGTGGHNVPIIYTKNGIRKLTPRECFNIMGYKEDFLISDQIAHTHLYKQAGNSVVIPVIKRIADNINNALNKKELNFNKIAI